MLELLLHFFIRPLWLVFLIPLIWWSLWQWQKTRTGKNVWHQICDPHLLPHLEFVSFGQSKKDIRLWLIGIAWFFTIFALAGPTWSKVPESVYISQQARVLILDLSATMNLKHAKYKLEDILKEYSQESKTALVVFAGEAYVVSPLTDDASTISHYMPALKMSLMRVPGKRTWLALQLARELLAQSQIKHGEVILITDDVNYKRSLTEAEKLEEQGHRLSILAVGKPEPNLQKMAAAGGGNYVELTIDDSDLNELLKSNDFKGVKSLNQKYEIRQDQGHWLLLPLLFVVALGFRRGWLAVLLLCVIAVPDVSYAESWNDMWQRPDQQTTETLRQGVSYYKAGDYDKAIDAFAQVDTAPARYNLGNALTRLGEYESAIKAYQSALQKNPQYAAAKHNLKIVTKLLEQQQARKPNPPSKTQPPKNKKEEERTGGSNKDAPKNSEKGKGPVEFGQISPDGGEGEVKGSQPKDKPLSSSNQNQIAEKKQSMEQWLENVEGDVAELLENQFQYQAQQHK